MQIPHLNKEALQFDPGSLVSRTAIPFTVEGRTDRKWSILKDDKDELLISPSFIFRSLFRKVMVSSMVSQPLPIAIVIFSFWMSNIFKGLIIAPLFYLLPVSLFLLTIKQGELKLVPIHGFYPEIDIGIFLTYFYPWMIWISVTLTESFYHFRSFNSAIVS